MLQLHEKKIIIFTGGTLIVLGALVVFFILPTIGRITELNQNIFTLQHDLELRYERTSNLRKSKINLGKVQQLTSDLQKLFVAPNHELDFIIFLEQTARARNLEQNITLIGRDPLPQTHLFALKTQLQVTGNYTDVLAYLLDLEQAQLAIRLSDITLTQGGPSVGHALATPHTTINTVTLSAEATAYVNP